MAAAASHGGSSFQRRLGTAAAWSVLPAGSLAWATQRAPAFVPADRPLRLAFAGIGNRGLEMLKTFASTNLTSVAAFCDVDLDAPHTGEARRVVSVGAAVPRLPDDARQGRGGDSTRS